MRASQMLIHPAGRMAVVRDQVALALTILWPCYYRRSAPTAPRLTSAAKCMSAVSAGCSAPCCRSRRYACRRSAAASHSPPCTRRQSSPPIPTDAVRLDARQGPTLARPVVPLPACVHRHPCTKTNKTRLLWQRPLGDRETNFRLIIRSRSSTDPEYLAEIGPVDFDMWFRRNR